MKSHHWVKDEDFEGTGFVCKDCNIAVLISGEDAAALEAADERIAELDREGCPYWG